MINVEMARSEISELVDELKTATTKYKIRKLTSIITHMIKVFNLLVDANDKLILANHKGYYALVHLYSNEYESFMDTIDIAENSANESIENQAVNAMVIDNIARNNNIDTETAEAELNTRPFLFDVLTSLVKLQNTPHSKMRSIMQNSMITCRRCLSLKCMRVNMCI